MPSEWKTGDTFDPIRGTARDGVGNAVDISTAELVRFIAANGPNVITGTATVLDDGTLELRGRWEYTWNETDLTTLGAGEPETEIEVTFDSGPPPRRATFPSKKANNPKITVSEDLD
jgi:hypothetical protein